MGHFVLPGSGSSNSTPLTTLLFDEKKNEAFGERLFVENPTHPPEYPEGAQEWEKEVEMEPRGGREWEGSRGEGE